MSVQITLYGESAERFENAQEQIARDRPGSKPGNAETVRVLLDEGGY
ncbi:hypothetical protein EGH21_05450 [Halomicroarcula sp. F13]|uniref:Uncharacterized protein n=1 Tax=Haloarcula rubra TaxID=2487747 RepID=A0AAW4PN18_9EURY|nr:hypothetical protein [Halomicroarcula rubra]MBX0322472.1 hypothetical protein [Halomicroarcula rubra]